MKLEMLDQAEKDLVEGFHFYEDQEAGLGSYFLANLYADIESLRLYGGLHRKLYKDYHRLLSQTISIRRLLQGPRRNCVHSCRPGLPE